MRLNRPIQLNYNWRSRLIHGIYKFHGYYNLGLITYMTSIAISNPAYVPKQAYIIMLISIAIYTKLSK